MQRNFKVVERSGLRWYYDEETHIYHPSVSTVNGWQEKLRLPAYKRKAGNGANFGTAIHTQIAKAIYDDFGVGEFEEVIKMPNIEVWNVSEGEAFRRINNSMKMWYQFLKDHPDFEPLETELVLFQDGKYPYAGRLDILAKLENKIYLIDNKTGGYYPEYDAQICGGYAGLLLANGYSFAYTALLFLDANLGRNPSQTYDFRVYSKDQERKGYADFLEKLMIYHKNDVHARVESGE